MKPKRLGRYTLLDRIAEGGSAEVFRGLEDRGHGIQRLVAVKVIHWELADKTSFLELFREETKVSLGLNHPNIVQTFDFGEDEDGRPFIVFEYVHGSTLRALLDRLGERETRLPVEISIFIAEQAAKALMYAHAFEEPLTGRVLNIVHRDLSPQNLMISYEGVPKLIDFGIAKVVQEKDRTQTGLIKGKPAYLSPEQVAGEPLDGRSDVFALGIVLWEMLTGAKLFAGGTALSIMERISSRSFVIDPPSKLNPDVPRELEQLVLKALTRDRSGRLTASELQSQLYKLISQKNRDTYFAEIGSLLGGLFGPDIARERAAIRRLSEEVEETTGSQLTDPSWFVPQPRSFVSTETTRSDIVSAVREVQELPPVAEISTVIELETRSEIMAPPPQQELSAPSLPEGDEDAESSLTPSLQTPTPRQPAAPVPPPEKVQLAKPLPAKPATGKAAPAKPERAKKLERTKAAPAPSLANARASDYVPPRTVSAAPLPARNEFTERYGTRKPSWLKAVLLGVGFSSVVGGVLFVTTRPQETKPVAPPEVVVSPAPEPAAAAVVQSPRPVRAKKQAKPSRRKRVFR